MRALFLSCFLCFISTFTFGRSALVQKFDHDFHQQKVFKKKGVACSECHQVRIEDGNTLKLLDEISKSTFKKTIQKVCHDCHNNSSDRTQATQSCYTCHDSHQSLRAIQPADHLGPNWKKYHSLKARTSGQDCQNCHTTNQCTQCHVARNPVTNQNHSRNYRYFHSIEARLSPQKCSTCHTASSCTQCHAGGRK